MEYLKFMKMGIEFLKKWLGDNRSKIGILPPYSPDLNPIEHAWENLKQFIKKLANTALTTIQKIHKYVNC